MSTGPRPIYTGDDDSLLLAVRHLEAFDRAEDARKGYVSPRTVLHGVEIPVTTTGVF